MLQFFPEILQRDMVSNKIFYWMDLSSFGRNQENSLRCEDWMDNEM